jgi:hypothetical protein
LVEAPILEGSLADWGGNALSYAILIGLALAVWRSLQDRSTTTAQIQSGALALVVVTLASIFATALAVGVFFILAFGWGESSRPPPLWVQWGWYITALVVPPTLATLAVARKVAMRHRRMVIIVGMAAAIVPEALYFVVTSLVLNQSTV